MKKRKFSLLSLLFLLAVPAWSQYLEVDDTYTAEQLVAALTGNTCSQISNISVSGANGASPSYGYFTAGTSGFPFKGGLVLSSGFAKSAQGPNSSDVGDGDNDWGGDADLEKALDIDNTFNATVLEFDFIPNTANISFDYIFASEEYLMHPSSADWCQFSDGFAFLIKEAGSAEEYRNLAVVPDTNIPVKVTSVRGPGYCPAANEQYFNGYNEYDSAINFNGQTVVLTAQSKVTPGTKYHIKLVIADQGDTVYDAAIFLGEGSFTAFTDLGTDRLLAANNPVCYGENVPLDATTQNAISYQWYKDDVAITGATNALYTATETGSYRAEIGLTATCAGVARIKLEFTDQISTSPFTYTQCDNNNDGLTGFNLNDISVSIKNNSSVNILSYHINEKEATDDTDALDTSSLFYNTVPNQTVYARVQNSYGCFANIPVVLATPAITATVTAPVGLCDNDGTDDGFTTFNLNAIAADVLASYPIATSTGFYLSFDEALIGENPIDGPDVTTFTNTIIGGQNLYARLENNGGCAAILTVPLEVYNFGSALLPETAQLCDNNPLQLSANTGFTYSWNTIPVQTSQSIIVTQPGTYTVTLTNAQGCQADKSFVVEQSGVPKNVTYTTKDFSKRENSLIISANGYGIYEYSLDGMVYQNSNTFSNLDAGEYTFYIRDINGCEPVYSKKIYILDYPAYFSPNADGTMDVWRISYLNTRPQLSVTIFDRYGKLITSMNARNNGWDGTLNGHALPADDYWFVITLENGEQVKGHFSLIR